MKAVICNSLDGFEALSLQEVALPEAGPGEVLIKVAASALNFADTLITRGKYQVKPDLPFSPGLEASGVIEALGEGVSGFEVGQRVMAVLDYGGFAEYARAKASDVFAIPEDMDFETAAAIPVAYGTSHHGLTAKAQLKPGDVLLVHGAAGGVGLTAVEIGKRLGATVIATAGGAEKIQIAKDHGADHVIDYREADIREEVKALTDGRGADVIYDPVGGDVFKASLRCIAPDGRILIIGFASGDIPQIPANIIMVKNITCIGYHWGAYRKIDPDGLKASFAELTAWIAEGSLKPHVSLALPLEDYAEAFKAIAERRSTGKVILKP